MIGTSISLYRDFNEYKKAIKKRFREIESSHMPSLATSLYTEDEPQIKNNISGILSVQDMSYLEVKLDDDDDGKRVLRKGEKKEVNILSHKMRIVYTNLEDPEAPLEPLGYLNIQASLGGVTEKIKNQIKSFVIIQLIQFILVTIIMYYIFRGLVSKHLERMSNYAESIDLKDLEGPELNLARRSINERDELDHVVISLNKMKNNLKLSHEQLKDYSDNLEQKVKDATEEIEDEKHKVDNLLNNMKQAIFVVNEDLDVIPPVSHFASNVFDVDIVGKNIFDTLFKDYDKNSETVANIHSALSLVFGDDYIQFELVEEHFLKKINYFSEISGRKHLAISYTPLFDKDELLINLMFVVDDITEKEKLEAEVISEKESNQKNISIITEMAKTEVDDLELFLDNAKGILQKSMILAKSSPNEEDVLHELFRFLHTLKGSARAFNFDSISSIAHLVESSISKNLEMVKKGLSLGRKDYEPLIDNLYILSQEVLEYGNLAKKVFKIENEFGKKLISDIQNHIIDIENITLKNISSQDHFLVKNEAFKKRKLVYSKIQDNPPPKESIENLKRAAHSLKSSLRASTSLMSLSETVHALEKSFSFFQDIGKTKLEEFSENFVENYFHLKDTLKSNFIQSHMNMPYSIYKEDWANVFVNLFKFSRHFDGNEWVLNKDANFILNAIIAQCEKMGVKLMAKEAYDLKKYLSKGELSNGDKVFVKGIMEDLWNYLILVAKLDFYHLESDLDKTVHYKFFEKLVPLNKIKDDNSNEIKKILKDFEIKSIVCLLLKKILKESFTLKQYFKELEKWTSVTNIDHYGEVFAFDGERYFPDLKLIRSLFKTSPVTKTISEKIEEETRHQDPIGIFLKNFFKEDSFYIYLKFIDFHQLVSGFLSSNKDEINLKKVEMYPVVMRNINKLENLIEKSGSEEDIKKAIKRLKDISVIPLLGKFKTMMMDMSEKLNKSISFEVKGSEISMNKESFHILQDAVVHLLRNSLDHGIESPDERIKIGKSSKGKIEILCFDDNSDELRIIIKDDGKGLNASLIKRKALEKGLVSEQEIEKLELSEIFEIIFMPTFSERDIADELSGRGVGMDIVKKNLEKIGGRVLINSDQGKGTEIILSFKPGPPLG